MELTIVNTFEGRKDITVNKLGNRLKDAREKKHLTQLQVAEKLGISNGTLSGYERNYRDPDTDTLNRLADLYNVSIDYLVGRTNDSNRVLQPHSRITIDMFEQNKSAEEIFQAFNGQFLVGGLPMAKEEALFIIDYLRTKWAMEMKQDPVSKQ